MTTSSWEKRRPDGARKRRLALYLASVGILALSAPGNVGAQPLRVAAADPGAPPAVAKRIDRSAAKAAAPAAAVPAALLRVLIDEPPAGPDERFGPPSQSDNVKAALRSFVIDPIAAMGDGAWPKARDGIVAAYQASNFTPLWIDDGGFSAKARQALERLRRADEDGLSLSHFALPADDWKPTSPADLAAKDVALSAAIVAYAEQASGSRLKPWRVSQTFDLKPEVADPQEALKNVAGAEDADAALAAYNPPHPEYVALRDILQRLRAVSKAGAGPGLKTASVTSDSATVVVPPTVDPAREIDAVLANMEMWRWAPRDLGATHIAVNIADFSLAYYKDGKLALQERVIVGKPDTPTSVFSNAIKYVLINPAWHVPDSIINKEFLPKLANDPDYLTRHGFQTKQVGDKLIVVQPPGEANALGHILFMFPNDHAIYLHDTPSRGLFSQSYRALSHGCVRLDQPFTFGALLLENDAHYANFSLQKAIGTQEQTLMLSGQTPIHIQYFTRFVDDSGLLQRRADLYGLERNVADMLSRFRQD